MMEIADAPSANFLRRSSSIARRSVASAASDAPDASANATAAAGPPDRFTNVQLFRRRRRGESDNQIARSLQRSYMELEDLQEEADRGTAAVLRDISEVLKDAESFVVNKDLESRFRTISDQIADAAIKARKHTLGVRISVGKDRVKGLGTDVLQAFNQLLRLARNAAFSPTFRRFVVNVVVLLRDTFAPRLALGPGVGLAKRPSSVSFEKERPSSVSFEESGGRAVDSGDDVEPAESAAVASAAAEAARAEEEKEEADKGEKRDEAEGGRRGRSEPERVIARRWMALFRELNSDAHLRRAVQDTGAILGMLADKYSPGLRLGGGAAQHVSSKVLADVQDNMDAVLLEFRRLLEALSGQDMDAVLSLSRALLDEVRTDAELSDWVSDVRTLVRDAGREEAFDEESFSRRLKAVIDTGRALWKGRHRELAGRALSAYYDTAVGISRDEDLRYLGESVQYVVQDLLFDREGRVVMKPDLYVALFQKMRPTLGAALSGFRIERVEHQDENIYFVVEDIAFHGLNAVPSELRVATLTDVTLGGTPESEVFAGVRLSGKGYNVDIRNLMFQYELRQFPRLQDRGLMDIALAGDGLSFDIDLVLNTDVGRILHSLTEERCVTCGRSMDDENHPASHKGGDAAALEKRWSAMSAPSRKSDLERRWSALSTGSRWSALSTGSRKRKSSKQRKRRSTSAAGTPRAIGPPPSGADGRMFHVKKVDVRLHGLQLRFRHANHSLLYKLLQPFMTSRIEKEIERTLEEKIYNMYDQVGTIFRLAQQYAFQGSTALSKTRILRGTDVNVGHVDYVPGEWEAYQSRAARKHFPRGVPGGSLA